MPPEIRYVKPKWKFKDGPFLEDVFLYRIKFSYLKGIPPSIINDWYVKRENHKGYPPSKRTKRPNSKSGPKPVKVGKQYFYVSLNRLTNRDDEIKTLTREKCGGVRVEVKELKNQTIELPIDFFNKMPLGTTADITKDQFAWPTGEKKPQYGWTRWHKIHIPTRYGGFIIVRLSIGIATLFRKDYKTPAVNAKGKPYNKVIARKKKKGIFRIPKDKHGTYYLKIEKSHKYIATVKFYEEGHARKRDGTPHIPWSFYYWPAEEKRAFAGPNSVLQKYAKAFGLDPSEVSAWEKGDGEDKGHYRRHAADWAGHCHNAVAASVYFEEPPRRGGSYKGFRFSQAQIEFLASEWAGNYKDQKFDAQQVMWDLNETDDDTIPIGGDEPNNVPFLVFFKPFQKVTPERFKNMLAEYLHIDLQKNIVRRIQIIRDVKELIRKKGGEAKFADYIKDSFGNAVARLHVFLQEQMLEEGEVVTANLRSDEKNDGPSPVWNYACFLYRSWMEEEPSLGDEKCIRVKNRTVWNDDDIDAIGIKPGFVTKQNRVKENKNHCVFRVLKYIIKFDDQGKIDVNDSNNKWEDVTDGRKRNHLFAPQRFIVLKTPTHSRPEKNPIYYLQAGSLKDDDYGLGNPFVDWRIVEKKLIRLIDKYEK
jgi:hypothetical protein